MSENRPAAREEGRRSSARTRGPKRDGASSAEPGHDGLGQLLREAEEPELLDLVGLHLAHLNPAHLRQIFRNPFTSTEVLRLLAGEKRLLQSYEARRGIAFHPRSPQVLALRFVPGLYWRDLVELAADVRVRPPVRRAAERTLVQRLGALALGERMAIARRASPGLVAHLRHDPSLPVIRALLENPRLTEAHLLPLANKSDARPQILDLLAKNPRWGSRYPLRKALCLNPATPVQTALSLLPHLRKADLPAVASNSRLASAVRQRARLFAGEERANH